MDALSVIDAAYRFDRPDPAWLHGIVEAALPFVDQGFGAWAFVFDDRAFIRGKLEYAHPTAIGLPPDWAEGLRRTLSVTTRDAHAMMEIVFGHPTHTMSRVLRENPKMLRAAQGAIALPGVQDSVGVTARDMLGTSVFIGAHAPRIFDLDAKQQARLCRLAAHIATAYRLRRSIHVDDAGTGSGGGGGAAPHGDLLINRAEAIIGARGKIAHATGAATSNASLEALKQAAIAVDHASRNLRKKNPDEALRAWEGLVRGRWSLIASFDDGGRRIFLAEPNEPIVPTLHRTLTKRERQVGSYLLLGHSYKLIAYELGLSEGTVSSMVSQLRRKLDAKTSVNLLHILQSLARRGLLDPATAKKRTTKR